MMVVTAILVVGVVVWGWVVSRGSRRKGGEVVRLGEKVWLTPGGIVDFGKKELEPWQEAHNARLDFEIAESLREFQHRERQAKERNDWFRREYPNASEATYGMNVIGPRRVIGIRYVV